MTGVKTRSLLAVAATRGPEAFDKLCTKKKARKEPSLNDLIAIDTARQCRERRNAKRLEKSGMSVVAVKSVKKIQEEFIVEAYSGVTITTPHKCWTVEKGEDDSVILSFEPGRPAVVLFRPNENANWKDTSYILYHLAMSLLTQRTPAARWREEGKEDDFAELTNMERAQLPLGDFTDDELANAMFLHADAAHTDRLMQDVIAGRARMPIVYITAAKERMRWLSRKLDAAERKLSERKPYRYVVAKVEEDGREVELLSLCTKEEADKKVEGRLDLVTYPIYR